MSTITSNKYKRKVVLRPVWNNVVELSVWFDDHVTVQLYHIYMYLQIDILPNDHVCIQRATFFPPILIVISSKFKSSERAILKPLVIFPER